MSFLSFTQWLIESKGLGENKSLVTKQLKSRLKHHFSVFLTNS